MESKIRAEEVRIGNIVNDEDLQSMYIAGVWPVNNGKQYNWIDSAGNTGNVNLLSGIPLSEQILLKCGFEKSGSYYVLNKFYVYLWGIAHFSFHNEPIMNRDDGRYLHVEFTTLHQLQNLYFCLTGKELEFKP